jgi:hypothetical protein
VATTATGRRGSRLWTWTLKEGLSPIGHVTRVALVDPTADPRIGVSSKCRRVRLGFPDRLPDPTSTLTQPEMNHPRRISRHEMSGVGTWSWPSQP